MVPYTCSSWSYTEEIEEEKIFTKIVTMFKLYYVSDIQFLLYGCAPVWVCTAYPVPLPGLFPPPRR